MWRKKMAKLTWRLWLLIIVLALSLLSIFVNSSGITFLQKGLVISSVESDSDAFNAGLRSGQIILSIDGKKINNFEDYASALEKYSGQDVKTIFDLNDGQVILFSNHVPDITVSEISKTNIKTGLDLAGGSRALVKAQDKELNSDETSELAQVISNRLNVYGITDMSVVPISDLSGNHYVRIEIAGATPEDLEKLISEQGKFEARIGNETVFFGGKDQGITSVVRSGQESGIESCNKNSEGGYYCNFRFGVFLSLEAAKRHASITNSLGIDPSNPQYLSEKLDLYLDDNLVDSLYISKDLQGRETTQIAISGSGNGPTSEEAYEDAKSEMNHLQTILVTGSLPYKLEVVKLDTISPVLGGDFINSIFLAAMASLFIVAIVIFIRYRKIKSSFALLITSISEIIIILGIASFIDWNLDLPSIAGILATIGTGIDQQIIILDEARQKHALSLKEKLKRAFAIISGAYFTALVSLLPLLWAGAGLLKGFAITTIIGITAGILITRPAFTDMVKNIEG